MNVLIFNVKNYIFRHLQVMLFALGQLWQQPLASTITLLVISIALALPAGLHILIKNIEYVSNQWDDASQISLFIQQDTSTEQAKQLTSKLRLWPEIANVEYQNPNKSLEEFRQLSGLGDLLNSLPSNPPARYYFCYPPK